MVGILRSRGITTLLVLRSWRVVSVWQALRVVSVSYETLWTLSFHWGKQYKGQVVRSHIRFDCLSIHAGWRAYRASVHAGPFSSCPRHAEWGMKLIEEHSSACMLPSVSWTLISNPNSTLGPVRRRRPVFWHAIQSRFPVSRWFNKHKSPSRRINQSYWTLIGRPRKLYWEWACLSDEQLNSINSINESVISWVTVATESFKHMGNVHTERMESHTKKTLTGDGSKMYYWKKMGKKSPTMLSKTKLQLQRKILLINSFY